MFNKHSKTIQLKEEEHYDPELTHLMTGNS